MYVTVIGNCYHGSYWQVLIRVHLVYYFTLFGDVPSSFFRGRGTIRGYFKIEF